MQGGDRIRFAETQRPESGGIGLLTRVIDLVGHQVNGNLGLAQQAHHVLIGGGGSHVGIHHKEHGIGQIDGHLCLGSHRRIDALRVGLPPAGVDKGEVSRVPLRLVRNTVAGHTGCVFDHGLTTTQDAVDQGRFAHVGAAHHSEHG